MVLGGGASATEVAGTLAQNHRFSQRLEFSKRLLYPTNKTIYKLFQLLFVEPFAKLGPSGKTMILSKFARPAGAEALPPSTILKRVGLGGRGAELLKRAF